MTLTKNQTNALSKYVSMTLEDISFRDLLEEFDLTAEEVFIHLVETGMIDTEKLEEHLGE